MLGAVQAPLAGCQLLTLVLRMQAAIHGGCCLSMGTPCRRSASPVPRMHATRFQRRRDAGASTMQPKKIQAHGPRVYLEMWWRKRRVAFAHIGRHSRLLLLILAGGRAPHGHSTHAQAVPLQPAGPQPALSAAGPEGTAVAACSLAQRARAAARRAAGGVRGQYGARPRRTRPRLRAACGLLARCAHGSAARQCLLP